MDIKKLQAIVIDALEDVKAQDIHLFDTTHLTSLFDRIVIASGTSNRQTKALASSVREKVGKAGGNVIGVEGEDTGEWVLVDLGDMLVHIMQPAIRAYYRLEEIWGGKEINLSTAKRTAKRTAASKEVEKKPTARKRVPAKAEKAETKKSPSPENVKKPATGTRKAGTRKTADSAEKTEKTAKTTTRSRSKKQSAE